MIAAFMLLLLSPQSEAATELPCEYCGAIFVDIQRNAMIGNGNDEVSSEWAVGREGDDVSIRIEELACPEGRKRKKCSFVLRRMLTRNGVATVDPILSERLRCNAIFKWSDSPGEVGWGVEHLSPRRGRGHSITSMTCKKIETGI